MNINEFRDMKKLKKFFVDPTGEIYLTEDLHEILAREICKKNHWSGNFQDCIQQRTFCWKRRATLK